MAVNPYRPHVVVLPEDDANNDLTNGFLTHGAVDLRRIQVLPCAGGWAKVRQEFESVYVRNMEGINNRHMILLVDFDRKENRREEMAKAIPEKLRARVFVIGVWSEPEDLTRAKLGTREAIGHALAGECYDETRAIWGHELLRHNGTELDRMTKTLRPILFPPA